MGLRALLHLARPTTRAAEALAREASTTDALGITDDRRWKAA
jgi:hypothetical protein